MLTLFRRRLGKLKDRLERHVATIGSGGKPRLAQAPISAADKDFMLEWITGKADDSALVARAKASPTGPGLIERACAARPANPRAWAARAEFCFDAGDLDGAADHAGRAHALSPLDPDIGLLAVRMLVAASRGAEALKIMPVAIENARRQLAHATRLALCELWRQLEPDSIEPLLDAARTHVAGGERQAAIGEFEALVVRFGPRAEVLLQLAAVYQDLARPADAARASLAATQAEPDNLDALCMAGGCARDIRDLATADRLLSRALELDPKSSFAHYYLGFLRLDQERIDEAAALVLGARSAVRGEPWAPDTIAEKLAQPVQRNPADVDWATARFKLVHDIEQFRYLQLAGRAGADLDPVIAEYVAGLRDRNLPEDPYSMVALHPGTYPMLSRTYKYPVHAPDPEPPQGPLANPDLDWKALEENYLDSRPGLVVVDNILAPEALESLRKFCLDSTIWNELKGGYLGAYMPDGFSGRLLLRLSSELRARMPRVFRDHPLQTMWGYKYDSSYTGMGLHVDVAAVNVNFWVTPDEANLDPETGGLVVYTHEAPPDRGFQRFNTGGPEVKAFLESVGAKKKRIPYRCNRAVLFDASLFHETDAFRFRQGYENRRVNVTMLYGT
jgi:tetratricopeptide (TPR) repeat protein